MPDPSAASNPIALFSHNWARLPSVTSSYETQIEQMLDGTEQRKSLRSKPLRSISTESMTIDEEECADLYSLLQQQARGDVYMPIVCDATTTTSAVTASATIPCRDTRYRRFAVGHRVMLVQLADFHQALTVRVGVILSITDTQIILTSAISGTLASGSFVFPVIESEVSLGQNAQLETDRVVSFASSLNERTNANTIPAILDPSEVPDGVASLRGLPVLDIPHQWEAVQEGLTTKGRTTNVGLGNLTTLYGSRSFDTARLSFLLESREEAWRLISFFDSCRGSARPFWYPHKTAVAIPSSASSFSVTVPENTSLGEWLARKVIAVWYKDGSVDVRIISSGIASSGSNILTVNSALSSSNVADMDYVAFGSLARFDTDELRESWETSDVLTTSLTIQSLAFTGDPTCIGLACEDGSCEEMGDCPEPPDPTCDDCDPGPPYDPRKRCIASEVSVPMYYDLNKSWNSGREPIRAADLTMPTEMFVEIRDGLVFDANHPYGQDISDELKEALFRTHKLTYAGVIDRTAKSRNPYHLRIGGGSPTYGVRSGGELVEDSPAWESESTYMVGETEHTLTVRLYAEYVDQSASTLGDSEYAAWGTIFCLWAWTTEIDMGYTDGTPYVPFNSKTFTESDPAVGGLYVSEASTVKRFHPKALFFAVCPTTWHSPIGYSHYSLLNRDQYKAKCFELDTGAPWSGGSSSDAVNNNAFGSILGSYKLRALGSLGGWTKSTFFNWTCIENGAGVGRTILKPTNAGWDESSGELTILSDIRLEVCTPPQTSINPCEGHPDDPYQGYGGTHDGFRDNTPAEDPSRLCYATNQTATVSADQRCVVVTRTYNGACEIYREDCEEVTMITTINMNVEDYFYGWSDGPTGNRIIEWAYYGDDPEYVRQDFPNVDLCDPQTACWTVLVGSGSIAAEAITATVTGGKNVGYLSMYAVPSSVEVVDGIITASTTRTGTQKMGVAMRTSASAGSIIGGYLAVVNETAGTFTLYVVTAPDTISVVATTNVTIPAGDYTISLNARGSVLRATMAGSVEATLSAEDCTYPDSGKPAIVALNTNGAVDTITVVDNNWQKLMAEGRVSDKAELYATIPFELTSGWVNTQEGASCEEGCEPSGCPSMSCPCTSVCKTLSSVLEADSSGYLA